MAMKAMKMKPMKPELGLPQSTDIAPFTARSTSRVRVLFAPDIDGEPTGEHLLKGAELTVNKRHVSLDGRVYFHIQGKEGSWVCATLRKDSSRQVVVSDGDSPQADPQVLVALLQTLYASACLRKGVALEDYPEVRALADGFKSVLTRDDSLTAWASTWGVLRGIRGESGVDWAAHLLAEDGSWKSLLVSDVPKFAAEFAARYKASRHEMVHDGAHQEGKHHFGSGWNWVQAFESKKGVAAFTAATGSMERFFRFQEPRKGRALTRCL